MNQVISPIRRESIYSPTFGFGKDAVFLTNRIMGTFSLAAGLSMECLGGSAKDARPEKRRYSLDELLQGVTEEVMRDLYRSTSFSQDGGPVGRELA